jgi:hypothetical protein
MRTSFAAVLIIDYVSFMVDPSLLQFTGQAVDNLNGYNSSFISAGNLIAAETDSSGDVLKLVVTSVGAYDPMANSITLTARYVEEAQLPYFNYVTCAIVSVDNNGVMTIPDPSANALTNTLILATQNKNAAAMVAYDLEQDNRIELDEDLSGQIDGVTDTYTVMRGRYVMNSLQVIVGGLPQTQNSHFTEYDADTGKFKTARPLDAEDGSLIVAYKY